VRFAFQDLPGDLGPARPVVDVTLLDLPAAQQTCLLDTGASDIRMSVEIAEAAGIELTDALVKTIVIAGHTLTGRGEALDLRIETVDGVHEWAPTVYFCDRWPFGFGLIGLGGLQPFRVTVCPYEEWSELALLGGG